MDRLSEMAAATAVWCDYQLERAMGVAADDPLAAQLRERAHAAVGEALVEHGQSVPLDEGEVATELNGALDALAESLPLMGWTDAIAWSAALDGGVPYGDFGLLAPCWPDRRAFRRRFVVEEPVYRIARLPGWQWVASSVTLRQMAYQDGESQMRDFQTEGAQWIRPAPYRLERLGADVALLSLDGGLEIWTDAYLRLVLARVLARGVRRLVLRVDGVAGPAGSSDHATAFVAWLDSRFALSCCCETVVTDRLANRLQRILPARFDPWSLATSPRRALEALDD